MSGHVYSNDDVLSHARLLLRPGMMNKDWQAVEKPSEHTAGYIVYDTHNCG